MMELLRNVMCYDPDPLGPRDVLIAGGQVVAIAPPGLEVSHCTVVDGSELLLVPGLVDALTHPCGGGGEGGFANRTPEVPWDAFIHAGVTSPIGALGTDGLGRSLDVLYATTMALRARGLAAAMYTGSYRVPAPTLTGDVARDLYLIEPVIGVGEVAIADHRGSQPTVEELRRLGSEAALGGVLAGRGGTVLVHVGDGPTRLSLLEDAVAGSDLPRHVFYPTHVNRARALLDEAALWCQSGGYVDITVSTTPELIALGDIPALDAFLHLQAAGAPADRITLSSDAGGSLPVYEAGVLRGLTAASPASLLELLQPLIRDASPQFPAVLAAMTRNPADALKLPGVGRLTEGGPATALLLHRDSGAIHSVVSRGRWLMRNGVLADPGISPRD